EAEDEIGESDADHPRGEGDDDADQEAVDQRLVVVRLAEELGVHAQYVRVVAGEALDEHPHERIDEKADEQHDREHGHERPEGEPLAVPREEPPTRGCGGRAHETTASSRPVAASSSSANAIGAPVMATRTRVPGTAVLGHSTDGTRRSSVSSTPMSTRNCTCGP